MEDRSLDYIVLVNQVAPSQTDTFRHVERRAFFYALNPSAQMPMVAGTIGLSCVCDAFLKRKTNA